MGNSGIDRETGITHPTYPSQVSRTVLFPWSPSAPPLPLEYLAANVILLHLYVCVSKGGENPFEHSHVIH